MRFLVGGNPTRVDSGSGAHVSELGWTCCFMNTGQLTNICKSFFGRNWSRFARRASIEHPGKNDYVPGNAGKSLYITV